jgi:hypothetical protein
LSTKDRIDDFIFAPMRQESIPMQPVPRQQHDDYYIHIENQAGGDYTSMTIPICASLTVQRRFAPTLGWRQDPVQRNHSKFDYMIMMLHPPVMVYVD